MKIVQYMLGFRNADGGVVRALIDLCNALAARGHEVAVLTTDASDAPRDWDAQAGRPALHTLNFSRWTRSLVSRESIAHARRLFSGADVIHLHVPWDPICAQLARVARGMGIPYVLSVHGMLDDWTMASKPAKKRMYLALVGRRLLEGAAFVQCSAQVEMEQSSKWYPGGRSTVVPLLFELEPFTNLPGPESARRTIPALAGAHTSVLCMGRLHPIKRIELLIQAIGRLRDKGIEARAIVAGSGERGYERRLREEVAARQLHDRIHFAGFVGGNDKLSLIQAADMVVHPSAHESFGFTMLEAMACGTPVIATSAVNIWTELEASGGALIVPPTDTGIAGAMAELIGDDGQRRRMGVRARAWVFSWLDQEKLAAAYDRMYRDAVGVNAGISRERASEQGIDEAPTRRDSG